MPTAETVDLNQKIEALEKAQPFFVTNDNSQDLHVNIFRKKKQGQNGILRP